ncbi:AgrD family cyclic lactone autoinducer peptide [Cohnella suwonensis]|uniref:AgrD family cyclic lactone autoinducer peptide n=1 Tax=Cohnella suwonensis TaxID=696072 RepID=A0ABW0LVY1_9BACL
MSKKLARLLALGLGLTAVVFVTTACLFAGHRPEVPAELLKK